jgi:NAD(P)-dependent dehydrogenase (short-subunit alcohol dehydrogenase family)
MNNAGIGAKGTSWDGLDNWQQVFSINVFGYVEMLCLNPS